MFRIERASYQQIREQTEHKDRYLSPNATFNATPTVTEDGKASSSSAAESVEEKGTRKNTRNKQNPRPDYNESRKSKASTAGSSRTRGSDADKGRDKPEADKRVVSGSGAGKTIATRVPQVPESAGIEEATQETSKDLPGEDQPALPAADDEDGDASPSQKISDITMIAEVKRMARGHSRKEWRDQILIQESAQMAAWIADVPMLLGQKVDATGRYRRLLLSQDQREIYITIATYTDKYIHYIMHSTDKPAYDLLALAPDCFLSMQPYGPFCVDVWEQRQELAVILVALSYQNYVI